LIASTTGGIKRCIPNHYESSAQQKYNIDNPLTKAGKEKTDKRKIMFELLKDTLNGTSITTKCSSADTDVKNSFICDSDITLSEVNKSYIAEKVTKRAERKALNKSERNNKATFNFKRTCNYCNEKGGKV